MTHWNFQAGKSTSRLKYVLKQQILNLTMHWIKEVEMAKSIDDLMTSRPITVRTDLTNHDMLDATIATALKKHLKSVHFRKRVRVEVQRPQKIRPILTREANCIHDVNSTPTNTARADLHSMITFHHANTRGSRAAKLRIAHLCVPKTIVIHVSCLVPCRT